MADFAVADRTRVMADMLLPAGSDLPPTRLGDIREATLLRMSARCLQDMDPRALDPLLDGTWLKGYDQAAVMAAVSCPALLLRADMRTGGMMPAENARRLASVMADCTIIDFEGTGHAIHWLAAEKTARHVLAFLESLR